MVKDIVRSLWRHKVLVRETNKKRKNEYKRDSKQKRKT